MDLVETVTAIRAAAPVGLLDYAIRLALEGKTIEEAREALAEARARDLFECFKVAVGNED